MSLANMTSAGEVVVNKGPPLKVSHTIEHGGDSFQHLLIVIILTILIILTIVTIVTILTILTICFSETVTTVSFDGITARVVRGDLECTNGYIHLLDR